MRGERVGPAPREAILKPETARTLLTMMEQVVTGEHATGKQAAIAGLGIVALPGYVCREELRSGALRRVLPTWLAGDSTLTALLPYRQGLLPSVRAFVEHLAVKLPKAVAL